MNARVVALLLAISAVSCEGDRRSIPTAPTPPTPVQIAGTWGGTLATSNYAATDGTDALVLTIISPVTMSLNQSGSTITGTWASNSISGGVTEAGTVSGTADSATFTGTITYIFGDRPTCQGTFSGSSTVSTLDWSSRGLTGNCWLAPPGNPLTMRFVLQRR